MEKPIAAKKKENQFANLLINIVIPVVLLTKFSSEEHLGPLYGLILAVLFPLVYGLYDLAINKRKNFVSILGLISIALTGGISLMKLPVEYLAIKESLIPFVIGVAILISVKTKYPLFNKLIFRNELVNLDEINQRVSNSGNEKAFSKVLTNANIFLSISFFISAALNYILAKVIVKGEPGTVEYNNELGEMTMMSYPVIVLPSLIFLFLILYYVVKSIKNLTGLETNQIFRS
ncbi:VC0807 family protein [Cytophagaceae bacterium ABcell3]|nr:VC0807 family protein [Cytophagaceae bacterium ABcell3]